MGNLVNGQQWSNGAGVRVEARYVPSSHLWELWIVGGPVLIMQRHEREQFTWLQGNGFTPVGE